MPQPSRNPVAVPAEQEATKPVQLPQVQRLSAIQKLALRLDVSPGRLQQTLLNTVFRVNMGNGQFRSPTDEEFTALVIVANELNLNPLMKHLYAFPKKGGGIEPMVSVDGWIFIMNSHPQFDGIEFEDIVDEKGKIHAIEGVIYRKDRSRPIRVTEYFDENVRETEPWKKMPKRMLRNRTICQTVRVAFGIGGVLAEGDEIDGEIILGGDLTPASPAPMRSQTREINYDPDTGEIADHQEGRADTQMGEEHRDADTGQEVVPIDWEAIANDLIDRSRAVETVIDYNKLVEEVQPHIDEMPDDEMAAACNRALTTAKQRLTGR